MKRIALFFYYLYALLTPVHDTFIFSPFLAWDLAGIADDHRKMTLRHEAYYRNLELNEKKSCES